MSTKTITSVLLQREVLLSLFLVGVVSAGLAFSTHALWSDSDRSTGNAVTAGTIDVTLDGQNSVSSTLTIDNGTPGDLTAHNFTVRNAGKANASHVDVALSGAENDPSISVSDADLAVDLNASETMSLINVTTLEYKNDSGVVVEEVLSSANDTNGNGIVDLEDVDNEEGTLLTGLSAPKSNGANATYLVIEIELANDDDAAFVTEGNTAGNLTGYDEDLMADGVDLTITFTIEQSSS